MTLANEAAARDEMCVLHKAAWELAAPTQGVLVLYTDVPGQKPKTLVPYSRLTITHNLGQQGSLSSQNGTRRWDRAGIITHQNFTPFADGIVLGYSMANVAVRAFEGKATPGGILFRNVRLTEIGESDSYFQINVIAEFEYEMFH